MFRDQIKLKFIAGKGGDGKVAYGPFEKPMGGIGGDGGNVYLEGDSHQFNYSNIHPNETYRAEDGEPGGKKNLTGKDGADLIFKVPVATKVYDEEGNLVLEIEQIGEKKLLLKGGRGGLGNAFLGRRNRINRDKATRGHFGAELSAQLELELVSDIIFIGLPNAGKSSILRELTNADAKVASYAFTTIDPQLGRMGEIILMDLPGLIEDTSQGKGLGTKFVKHTRRCQLVAHFISLESTDITADYATIRKELAIIDPDLAAKPEIIILTKTDMVDAQVVKDKITELNKPNITSVSVYDDNSLKNLALTFTKLVK